MLVALKSATFNGERLEAGDKVGSDIDDITKQSLIRQRYVAEVTEEEAAVIVDRREAGKRESRMKFLRKSRGNLEKSIQHQEDAVERLQEQLKSATASLDSLRKSLLDCVRELGEPEPKPEPKPQRPSAFKEMKAKLGAMTMDQLRERAGVVGYKGETRVSKSKLVYKLAKFCTE